MHLLNREIFPALVTSSSAKDKNNFRQDDPRYKTRAVQRAVQAGFMLTIAQCASWLASLEQLTF